MKKFVRVGMRTLLWTISIFYLVLGILACFFNISVASVDAGGAKMLILMIVLVPFGMFSGTVPFSLIFHQLDLIPNVHLMWGIPTIVLSLIAIFALIASLRNHKWLRLWYLHVVVAWGVALYNVVELQRMGANPEETFMSIFPFLYATVLTVAIHLLLRSKKTKTTPLVGSGSVPVPASTGASSDSVIRASNFWGKASLVAFGCSLPFISLFFYSKRLFAVPVVIAACAVISLTRKEPKKQFAYAGLGLAGVSFLIVLFWSTAFYHSQKASSVVTRMIGNMQDAHSSYLDLRFADLETLPPEIAEAAPTVTELHLEDNKLMELPPEIGTLTLLTELNLSGNQLTTLPPEIGNLSSLKVLNLSSNPIRSLPAEIRNLADTLLVLDVSADSLHEETLTSDQIAELMSQLPNTTILSNYTSDILGYVANFAQVIGPLKRTILS